MYFHTERLKKRKKKRKKERKKHRDQRTVSVNKNSWIQTAPKSNDMLLVRYPSPQKIS